MCRAPALAWEASIAASEMYGAPLRASDLAFDCEDHYERRRAWDVHHAVFEHGLRGRLDGSALRLRVSAEFEALRDWRAEEEGVGVPGLDRALRKQKRARAAADERRRLGVCACNMMALLGSDPAVFAACDPVANCGAAMTARGPHAENARKRKRRAE